MQKLVGSIFYTTFNLVIMVYGKGLNPSSINPNISFNGLKPILKENKVQYSRQVVRDLIQGKKKENQEGALGPCWEPERD